MNRLLCSSDFYTVLSIYHNVLSHGIPVQVGANINISSFALGSFSNSTSYKAVHCITFSSQVGIGKCTLMLMIEKRHLKI